MLTFQYRTYCSYVQATLSDLANDNVRPCSNCQDRVCELTETLLDNWLWALPCSAGGSLQSVQRCLTLTRMAARRSRGRCWGAPRFRLCAIWALAAATAAAAPAAARLGRARLAGAAVAALPSALIPPRGT